MNSTLQEMAVEAIALADNLTSDPFLQNLSAAAADTFFGHDYNFTNTTISNLSESLGGNSVGSIVLGGFLVLGLCYAVQPSVPDARFRRANIARERERIKQDPERRRRFIEASLITKRVLASEENTLRLGDDSGSLSLEDSKSLHSLEDEETSSCIICLEAFRKGDYVTFSKSTQCMHVFHQECLEEWLKNPKHDECPSCRFRIITDDGDKEEILLSNGNEEPASMGWLIINGLVSPLKRARDSLVGSSIQLEDCSSSNGPYGHIRLRRTVSTDTAERRPSIFDFALRRVSSGIQARYSGTFDSQEDDVMDPETPDLGSPIRLRRSLSEGLAATPRMKNSYCKMDNRPVDFDLELGEEKEAQFHHVQKPFRRFTFLPFHQSYTKISSTFDDGDNSLFEDIEEDELEPVATGQDRIDYPEDVGDGSDKEDPNEESVIEMTASCS
jgi:hypothetical protein